MTPEQRQQARVVLADARELKPEDRPAFLDRAGHRDVKTAMHYQHPEPEIVRAALDYGAPTGSDETDVGVNPKNETVKEDTLCRKGNCEWQRDGIRNIFDRWQWSE